MARFAALDLDSGSDSSEEEVQKPSLRRPPTPPSPPKRRLGVLEEDDEGDDEASEVSDELHEEEEEESGMDEDDVGESPPRHRQRAVKQSALVEGEDGEFRFGHELEPRASTSTTSHSPPTTRYRPLDDPTVIPWAQQIGLDAAKVKQMQASMFKDHDVGGASSTSRAGPGQKHKLPVVKPFALQRKHSRDSEGDGLRHDSQERASFGYDVDPPHFRPSRKYTRVDTTASLSAGHEGAYYDAGLSLGASFRVGWGPGGKLVHIGAICSPFSNSQASKINSVLNITNVVSAYSSVSNTPPLPDMAQKLLQHHLSHSTLTRDSEDVPVAVPSSSVTEPTAATLSNTTEFFGPPRSPNPLNFSSFVPVISSTDLPSISPIFSLGRALFDPIDLRFGRTRTRGPIIQEAAITPDVKNRVLALRRKDALSRWLEDVVKPAVEGDLRIHSNGSSKATYTSADIAFTHLTGHQVSSAASQAADGGYLKLATLISQAGGDDLFREDLISQIEIWKSEKLNPGTNSTFGGPTRGLIERGVWRVYRLLGGLVIPEEEQSEDASLYAGLDWKRIFGLFLWYATSVDASIADVVETYEELLQRASLGTSLDISRPQPKWVSQHGSTGIPPAAGQRLGLSSKARSDLGLEDPLFTLIKLYADPALTLSSALHPLSFGPSRVGWGIAMSWHLYIVLSRVMKVRDFSDRSNPISRAHSGKGHGSQPNGHGLTREGSEDEEGNFRGYSATADLLTSTYAFELESWGLVQEAAFVLLHLEQSAGRERAIKDLLYRNGTKIDQWTERGLLGLKLPASWVDEAKALNAYDNGDMFGAYELYSSAQLYNAAHTIAVVELAPDAIIRKDLGLIHSLFSRFDADGKREKIEGWFVRGKMFLEYVDILTRLPKLLDEVSAENEGASMPDAAQLDQIEDLSKRISKIIGLLPDALYRSAAIDPRHPAALEEMTKDLVKLLERSKPLLLAQIPQPSLAVLDGATRINLAAGVGYARFLQSIQA